MRWFSLPAGCHGGVGPRRRHEQRPAAPSDADLDGVIDGAGDVVDRAGTPGRRAGASASPMPGRTTSTTSRPRVEAHRLDVGGHGVADDLVPPPEHTADRLRFAVPAATRPAASARRRRATPPTAPGPRVAHGSMIRAVGDADDPLGCRRRRDRAGGRDHDLAGGQHLAAGRSPAGRRARTARRRARAPASTRCARRRGGGPRAAARGRACAAPPARRGCAPASRRATRSSSSRCGPTVDTPRRTSSSAPRRAPRRGPRRPPSVARSRGDRCRRAGELVVGRGDVRSRPLDERRPRAAELLAGRGQLASHTSSVVAASASRRPPT